VIATPPLRFATAAMGTRFELVLGDGRSDGRALGEAALEEIELWHQRLTRFAPASLLSHINRTAAAVAVRLDRGTFALFEDALAVERLSGGAFAVGLGSAAADDIMLDARACTIRFTRPGVVLDLGGIAKGHAIDRAAALLREHGVRSALLHGGTSSMAVLGAPSDYSGWKVALARVPGAPVVALRDCTMNVSWPASQQEQRGGPHIIDARSGEPAADRIVAVIGPSARLGDAWATALAVLGVRPASLPAEWTTCIVQPGSAPQWSGPAAPEDSVHG
jgi:FAD:protein FMN transferase